MKQYYMITGMNIHAYSNEGNFKIMKLTLIPHTNVKVEHKLKDMLDVGNVLQMAKDTARELREEELTTIVYVNCKECYPWIETGYKIGRHVTIDLEMDNDTGGVDVGK